MAASRPLRPARFRWASAALLLLLTLVAGCSWFSGPTEVVADGEQRFTEEVDLGEPLVLDMRDPALSGYAFAGTSFDPVMFRLDSVLEEGFRARYVFMPLAAGKSTIEVRIRAKKGGPLETYKRIEVTVED